MQRHLLLPANWSQSAQVTGRKTSSVAPSVSVVDPRLGAHGWAPSLGPMGRFRSANKQPYQMIFMPSCISRSPPLPVTICAPVFGVELYWPNVDTAFGLRLAEP